MASDALQRNWLRRADPVVLLGAFLAFASVLVFLLLANWVVGAPPHAVDEGLLRSLRHPDNPAEPLGSRSVQEAARDITALGGYAILALLTGSVLAYLLMNHHSHAAVLVFCATAGGTLLSSLLKSAYDRPRPDLVPHLTHVSTSSFPSGHAMLSAVVYLTLGALLARLSSKRRAKVFFVGTAILLTLMVGATRVYLGVHYPTDVVAGWCAGVAWATLCWLVARYLQHRGTVDQTAD